MSLVIGMSDCSNYVVSRAVMVIKCCCTRVIQMSGHVSGHANDMLYTVLRYCSKHFVYCFPIA